MDINSGGEEPEEEITFRLGEMFDSYEELEHKLEKFSRRSLVHYWRRDSRTVSGAHMKTARQISERLKYYSVKYACIYGGQKFLPRGAGRRQSQSIRTNCPAHIMLRASKDGTKLEVTSVNNEHNHEISEELFKNLPQERKLCGEIKQEVQDLLQLHIDRKRLKEYVRLRTNKILRSKDLINIAAANKQKREITPERAYQLFKKIHDIEKLQNRDIDGHKRYSESEEELSQTIKRIKREHDSSWTRDNLTPRDLEVVEANDCEDSSYATHLNHDEVSDEMEANEDHLLGSSEGKIITASGQIVGELVMEDGDPSVIVESIVNTDGSVFVDEREFDHYCNNHLSHSVNDSESPSPQVLDIETITSTREMEKFGHRGASSPETSAAEAELQSQSKSQTEFEESMNSSPLWIMKEANNSAEVERENYEECEASDPKSRCKSVNNGSGSNLDVNTSEVVLSDEASQELLREQLAVLRAERSKLFQETEMLKLKKDKLKLQISCYTNEIRKQEMEKEKLRLEIKLLQSKVCEDANDVSHYIFVP